MGASASVQVIVNNINTTIKETLIQEAEASASATCKVEIGSIVFNETTGCTIRVENLCSASASAQVDAITKSAINVNNTLSAEQQAKSAELLTVSINVAVTVNNIMKNLQNI